MCRFTGEAIAGRCFQGNETILAQRFGVVKFSSLDSFKSTIKVDGPVVGWPPSCLGQLVGAGLAELLAILRVRR